MKITLKMIDTVTNEPVERTISATSSISSGDDCWELKGKEHQRKTLCRWIKERANVQNKTVFELVSWVIEQD
jgi:hypothetical protein